MNLYAVRDRLIDYFMPPFVGPDDKSVLAAMARQLNDPTLQNGDMQNAPHQFEVWKVAEVLDDGHIKPDRQLIENCSRLIRASVRESTDRRTAEIPSTAPSGAGALGKPRGVADAVKPLTAVQTPAADLQEPGDHPRL